MALPQFRDQDIRTLRLILLIDAWFTSVATVHRMLVHRARFTVV
jgi:hypothetical protein